MFNLYSIYGIIIVGILNIYTLYCFHCKVKGRTEYIFMKKRFLIVAIAAMMLSFAGCGNTETLDNYYDGMQTFNGNIQIITETLELIDADKDSAANQVCTQLDKLVEQFRIMSELEVPKSFEGCDELGDSAYEYMQEADRLYKEWANDENADDQLVTMAKENYERAMQRVTYISIILQGGKPEGDGVTVIEEDLTDFTPVANDSETEEDSAGVDIESIEE